MSEPAGVAVDFAARDEPPSRLVVTAAAAAGGVLYFLGYLGWGAWPCLFGFLVPLWWALTVRPDATVRSAAGLGFAFGCAAFAGGHLWLLALIGPFLDGRVVVGALLWVAYGLWFALAFGVYGALVHAIRRRGWPIGIAGVAPSVLVEWLQPQIFPLYAGNGLVAAPILAQTADLGGPLLLTALVAGANVVLFETVLWLDHRRSPPRGAWITGAVGALAVLAYGQLRMTAYDAASAAAPALRVGLVQLALDVRAKDSLGVVSHREHLDATRALLRDGDLDVVVWPESAYVRGIRRPLPVASAPIVADVAVPLLFGASSTEERGGRKVKINSAFLAGADGMIRESYDKNLLIPLAESLPVAALAAVFPHAEEFAAATTMAPLHLGDTRIATPICYEVIRPELVRRMVRATKPHLLVTLANDAWFGDSQEPWLHLGLAQLRAIEQRRWMVRATNSGVSAIVDPSGRTVERTGLLTRENLRGTVHLLGGETIYARLGDWPGWLALAVVVGTLLAATSGAEGIPLRTR